MSSTLITDYIGTGLASARPASPPIAATALGFYFATDTGALSIWDGGWVTLAAVNLIPTARLIANTTGSNAIPVSTTLTALIDAAIGAAQGDILYRSATVWSVLAPATAGQMLITGGGSGNPSWTTAVSLSVAQSWTAAQRGAQVTLTDATSVASDFAVGNNFNLTIAGNRTLANPTNIVAGQEGRIVVKQDATGTRTLAYGSVWKFPGAVAPVLSTAANATDMLNYYVIDATHIAVSAQLAIA